jgi:hypothetical protein
MYFNHAYQKTLINTSNFYSTTKNTVSTIGVPTASVAVIASLQTSAYNANTVVDTTAFGGTTLQDLPMIYLAQGSINTLDKLGPFAGGYKESVKTKGINPKYVNKFFRVDPTCPQAEVTTVCLCDGAEAQCGTSYYLRIDVKGSPALRFLTHNAYRTFASNNICCPLDPKAPTAVDAMQIIADWAWQISRDPIMKNFILGVPTWNNGSYDAAGWFAANPTAAEGDMFLDMQDSGSDFLTGTEYIPGTSTALCLTLIGSYVDTQFGTCSFHPQDFYELAPVKIYPSMTDQLGDPCVDKVWCIPAQPDTLGVQGSGYGHKYLRDAILFRRYMQEQYVYDPRLREVMNQDQVYNYIIGTNFYTAYGILHSVPRFNNPTSTFDNDQYLITIIQPDSSCGTDAGKNTQFENWMNAYLAKAGNGVQLEILA